MNRVLRLVLTLVSTVVSTVVFFVGSSIAAPLAFALAFGAVAPVSAQTCGDLFVPSVTTALDAFTADTGLSKLRAVRESLRKEQIEARDREWTPAQRLEISKKGRLEFDGADRAIKYYRGLLVWKIRTVDRAIQEREDARSESIFRARWDFPLSPASPSYVVKIGDHEVAIFSRRLDFHQARRLIETHFGVRDPHPRQIASILLVMNHHRNLRRTSWADKSGSEAWVLETLNPYFASVSTTQRREISAMALSFRDDRVECCGAGGCGGCTHPNVVFRDRGRRPGPTFLGEAPPSTLPLYRILDELKIQFPGESWGSNFWDERLDRP